MENKIKNKMKKNLEKVIGLKKIFCTLMILLLLITCVFSISPEAKEEFDLAQKKLSQINQDIRQIREEGFATVRFIDEFVLVREIYSSAYLLADANKPTDLKLFYERIENLEKLLINAKEVRDELIALKKAISEVDPNIDTNQVQVLYNEAEQEFNDQRYEFSMKKIDAAYEKIVELQGIEAKASAAYEAAQKNIVFFFENNWKTMLTIILIIIIVYLIFRKKIHLYYINNKIESIEFEINVLKNEIKKSQENYFISGSMTEEEYTIKAKMYAEKIRDLRGTLALYQEKKEKFDKKRHVLFNKNN